MRVCFGRRDFLRRAGLAAVAAPWLSHANRWAAFTAPEAASRAFQGIFAILQTPFDLKDRFDEEDLDREADFCARAGAHGLVWPQVYGEFYALSEEERKRGAEIIARAAKGRSAVVIGVQAPTKEMAVQFARHAEEKGADAVIAIPPFLGHVTLETVADYYRAIAGAVKLPVFIQNSGGEWGPALSTEFVIKLARENPRLGYVKEEVSPVTHRLGEYVRSGAMRGIFSGNAGKLLLNELARGSSGTMPACEFVDVDVQIYDLAKSGQAAEARRLFEKLLPMINLEETYGLGFPKAVLVRRGVFKTSKLRGVPLTSVLDAVDVQELEGWWDQLKPYFKV